MGLRIRGNHIIRLELTELSILTFREDCEKSASALILRGYKKQKVQKYYDYSITTA
jgi:hypothetical protein